MYGEFPEYKLKYLRCIQAVLCVNQKNKKLIFKILLILAWRIIERSILLVTLAILLDLPEPNSVRRRTNYYVCHDSAPPRKKRSYINASRYYNLFGSSMRGS